MNTDEATKAWLRKELVSVLGFAEVDDILSYILTSFQTKEEVVPYLTELLGLPQSRAEAISTRLFSATKQRGKQQQQQKSKQQPVAQATTPLVPKPTTPNSRIRPTKAKKPSKLLHSRIINCLKCGKIEHNGARRCSFCDMELRYEELDEEFIDRAAQEQMKRLVEFDTNGAERTKVVDTEEFFYDEVENSGANGGRHEQPIIVSLDLENRQFTTVPTLVANHELQKDARELLSSIQKELDKGTRGGRNRQAASLSSSSSVPEESPTEDEFRALYI